MSTNQPLKEGPHEALDVCMCTHKNIVSTSDEKYDNNRNNKTEGHHNNKEHECNKKVVRTEVHRELPKVIRLG